jgi:hypothetical protein
MGGRSLAISYHSVETLMVELREPVPSSAESHRKESGPDSAIEFRRSRWLEDDRINHEKDEIHERIQRIRRDRAEGDTEVLIFTQLR